MQATREMGFRSPNLSLRIRASDPDALWQAAHQTLSTGQGLPALYNEDLIASMLVELGYPEQRSPGLQPGRLQPGDPARAQQLRLRCGLLQPVESPGAGPARWLYDPILGEQVGPHTGALETIDSYARLEQAYDRQMRYMTRLGVAINDKDMFLRQKEGACVRSLLTMDCLERGRGLFHGGARFYNIQNEACGITNAANALYALKTLVFEEGTDLPGPPGGRYWTRDWDGQEALRLRFKNKPAKFGNNQAEVDAIRARIASDWYREIQQYPAVLGGFHWPGEVVFVYHEPHGAFTAASADGRKAREPLANSAGATSGTDLSGPTALMNSMWKIPQDQCRTCCVLNLRFSKKVWQEAQQAMQDLMQTYFSQRRLPDAGEPGQPRRAAGGAPAPGPVRRPDRACGRVLRLLRAPARSLQEEILARTEHEL